MVQLHGHLAMALLFSLPAWMLWDGRTAIAFIAFVVSTSTVPDLDLVLGNLGLPVEHHGAMHTVVFVVGVAVIAGLLAVAVFRPILRRWWRLTEGEDIRRGTIYLFVAGGFVLGGLSHLFADMIAADGYQPIEPLWPVMAESVSIYVAHFTSPWLNLGLLIVAVGLHLLVVVSATFPLEHRYRHWRMELASDG